QSSRKADDWKAPVDYGGAPRSTVVASVILKVARSAAHGLPRFTSQPFALRGVSTLSARAADYRVAILKSSKRVSASRMPLKDRFQSVHDPSLIESFGDKAPASGAHRVEIRARSCRKPIDRIGKG